MHRFTIPLTIATVILLSMQAASLWMVEFTTPSRQTNIALVQGCLRIYIASGLGNERPGTAAGIASGGWSGDALCWKPEFDANFSLWVTPPGAAAARRIAGTAAMLPIAYPLVLSGTAAGWAWVLAFRRARRGTSVCRECGYDLRGLPGRRCPECGQGLLHKLSLLAQRIVSRRTRTA